MQEHKNVKTQSDEELANWWRATWKGTQRQFCFESGINQGNFSQWLVGKKRSPTARVAVINYQIKLSTETSPIDSPSKASAPEVLNLIPKISELKLKEPIREKSGAVSQAGEVKSERALTHVDQPAPVLVHTKNTQLQQFTPVCSRFLKGICYFGDSCKHVHPNLDYGPNAMGQIYKSVRSGVQHLCNQGNLHTIVFVDGDNGKLGDDFFRKEDNKDILVLVTYSPHKSRDYPSDPRLRLIPALTDAINAVDQVITKEAVILDQILPSTINFLLVTNDWFAVELLQQLRTEGNRTCDLISFQSFHESPSSPCAILPSSSSLSSSLSSPSPPPAFPLLSLPSTSASLLPTPKNISQK